MQCQKLKTYMETGRVVFLPLRAVRSVNGITADWEAEKAYWAFYIGEEYAQTGVDATDIVADTEYSFVKTISE